MMLVLPYFFICVNNLTLFRVYRISCCGFPICLFFMLFRLPLWRVAFVSACRSHIELPIGVALAILLPKVHFCAANKVVLLFIEFHEKGPRRSCKKIRSCIVCLLFYKGTKIS